ncbi:iron complex transport system substrate-binding protein [Vibrio xiamenensis]|uniref:Iron complex transport system substrate-binding protein n=1 Tax=Vibrio xiamenensis TaxID=861298 RepID=A0A1G8HSP7_9VIBR|nr:siderophore ABC transporter substrate-binding protein [Vibrio xiamenensis]SDI09649.1 iron complex transport system substrate-binding protein [Vibrio xiamenensis]
MKRIALAFMASVVAFGSHAEMVEIKHEMGTTQVETNPSRVVVLGIGALDVVDSLGINPVAVSKVSMLPDYLKKYSDYPSSGSLFEPDFEAIYNDKPDVIIAGPRSASHYDELSKIAPTVIFGSARGADYWPATQQEWRKLGKVFDKQQWVEKKITELDAQFKAIRDYNQAHNADALTVMSSGGNITTFGAHSRFSIIYKDFGFNETVKNIKPSQHGDLISYEYIQKANPSTLFIIDRDKLVNKGQSHTHQEFENDLVKSTKAYKNQHMKYLDLNAWYLAISGVKATENMVADIESSIGMN